MAKCPVCSSRKAKRRCLITDSHEICSLCCGRVRQESTCSECVWWQPPVVRRDYGSVPAFTVGEMDARQELQDHARVIESAIAAFDRDAGNTLRDEVPIRIYERLLDEHHFGEPGPASDDEVLERGLQELRGVIARAFAREDPLTLVKTLGVLRFIARRRTRGRREYLEVVHRFTGWPT